MSDKNVVKTVPDSLVSAKHLQVASIYNDMAVARESIQELRDEANVENDQIVLIKPDDDNVGRTLEKSPKRIGRILLKEHLILGGSGFLVGMACAWLLINFGPAFTAQNPTWTYIALISPGLFIGIFIAGLFGLRPDRDPLFSTIRAAMKKNCFTVVVNLRNEQSIRKVMDICTRRSVKTVEVAK